MTAYNKWFYQSMMEGSSRSAARVLPALFALKAPESVLDLGCGQGTWLRVAKELGARTVIGFDGEYVRRDELLIDAGEFHAVDLFREFPAPQRVDLALSLEVAEHLPPSQADNMVEFLVACSDVIYFGAAIPRQGGTDHFNEQWQSYWAEKFAQRGYGVSTALRDLLWRDRDVGVWYRQNALVFVKHDQAHLFHAPVTRVGDQMLDVVHPDLYTMKMVRYAPLESGLAVLQRVANKLRGFS